MTAAPSEGCDSVRMSTAQAHDWQSYKLHVTLAAVFWVAITRCTLLCCAHESPMNSQPTYPNGVLENTIFMPLRCMCVHCERRLTYLIFLIFYKGSAPRAADATRYARARQGRMQLKTYKGGREKRPMIWCEQQCQELLRANCPVVLSCAVCFCYRCYVLIGSTGVICVGGKTGCRKRSNTYRKRKKRKSSTPYTTTRITPGTALCSKEST